MKATDLNKILEQSSPGVLELGSTRMVLFDILGGFWGIIKQMEALFGKTLAASVLQQAGANGGASFAKTFVPEDLMGSQTAFLTCLQAYQLAGFGVFEIKSMDWNRCWIQVKATNTFEAWMMLENEQGCRSPSCFYTAGVLVGFMNVISGRKDIVCVEHSCQGCGDQDCLFQLLPSADAVDQEVIAESTDPGLGRDTNLLKVLFERMPMGIAILDREYCIQRYNPTWAEFALRYSHSSPTPLSPGVSYFDHIPDSEPVVLPLYQRVLEGETIQRVGLELNIGGMTTFWDVVLTPIVEGDVIVGILNVAVDATERMEAQLNLEQRVLERTEELNRRREIAESLRDIIGVLNSSQSLKETLAFIAKEASLILKSQACLIHHVEEDIDFVSIEASFGLPEELREVPGFPLYSSPTSDEKILNREPVWIDDFRKGAQLTEEALKSLDPNIRKWRELISKHYRAWLAIPLIVADKVYGSLAFYYSSPKMFDKEEIALSQSFAEQASLAIHNAKLYKEVEQASIASERNRLARDLHDAVTQTLFSSSMIADVLPKIWERNPEEGKRQLEELRLLTRGALSEMRTLLVELRPSALADTDIGDLIGHQVNALVARKGITVEYDRNCPTNPPAHVKEMFYRVTQEAFNNIAKHADASIVRVKLDCKPDKVRLVIQDDGVGFDEQLVGSDGLGLGIMRERAQNAGGRLEISSKINKGTILRITWPELKNREHNDD